MLDSLIFTEKVVNLRAWQLYLGNGIWTLFVGLVLLLLGKLFGVLGINNSQITGLLQKAGAVATDKNSNHVLNNHHNNNTESYTNYRSY